MEVRRYDIFLIEEEVASVYIGKEELLFQLFKERKHHNLTPKFILDKQIDYVTRPIPSYKIDNFIKEEMKNCSNYHYNHLLHKINEPNGQAELKIYEKYLILTTEGDLETEMIFFELLRKMETCYLAIDYTNTKYGWLKPIREHTGDHRKRIVVL
jgi:hypothetical protein